MLSRIRKYRFHKAVQSHANYGRKVDVRSVNLGSSIAVLSRWHYRDEVRRLVAHAAAAVRDVHMLYYSAQPVEEQLTAQENVYVKKQLKFGAVPESAEVEAFLGREYDRLFLVDTVCDMHQEYVCRLAKSRLSVGPLLERSSYQFDFAVDVEQGSVSHLVDKTIRALDLVSR